MSPAPARACALLLSALLTAGAGSGFAQSEENEADWYRVEMLILANRDPEAALSERWPLLPDLEYPDQWVMLGDESLSEPGDREFRLVTVEESIPQPVLDLMWDRSVEELLWEYRNKRLLREPVFELEPLIDLEVPRQRVMLPADQRELNSQRRRIQSSAGLEVLFHKAWLQRIASREEALPLIIDGPIQFGDYPELQGSILLYSGRYLHVASNLWLNTRGDYLDEESINAGWRMPRPPLPVSADQAADVAVVMTPFKLDIAADWLALPEEPVMAEDSEAEPLEDGGMVVASDDTWDFDLEHAASDEDQPEAEDAPGHEPVSDEALQAFLDEPLHDYDFRHALLLQQSRRMRSGELHYIDHPLIGIVVKISRHEFEPFVQTGDDSLASAR